MCRYAQKSYKPHFVCFSCRKTFKQPILEDIIMENGDWDSFQLAFLSHNKEKSDKFCKENPVLVEYLTNRYLNMKHKCPDCKQEMYPIGKDFKAPKKGKIREWAIIQGMYKLGNTFHSCGCYGPGYIPAQTKDYLTYLKQLKSDFIGQRDKRKELQKPEALNDYIQYWQSKLDLLELEIRKFTH